MCIYSTCARTTEGCSHIKTWLELEITTIKPKPDQLHYILACCMNRAILLSLSVLFAFALAYCMAQSFHKSVHKYLQQRIMFYSPDKVDATSQNNHHVNL